MKQLLTSGVGHQHALEAELADDRRCRRLHGDGADGAREREHARLERVEAEPELQEERQQEGHGADADAVEEAADDAREEGIDLEQVEIEQRSRRRARVAHIEPAADHAGREQRKHHGRRQEPLADRGEAEGEAGEPDPERMKPFTSSGGRPSSRILAM